MWIVIDLEDNHRLLEPHISRTGGSDHPYFLSGSVRDDGLLFASKIPPNTLSIYITSNHL